MIQQPLLAPIIITGGPGAGKTTLINALAQRGFDTFAEVSRELIEQQSQIDNGILPWQDLPGFAQLCLVAMTEQKVSAQAAIKQQKVCFMDRAIPDICAYLQQASLPVNESYLTGSCGYHSTVFFCRPEASIYVQDDVRPYPFEEAVALHEQLCATYQAFGYQIIEIPWGSIEQRVDFIQQYLKKAPMNALML